MLLRDLDPTNTEVSKSGSRMADMQQITGYVSQAVFLTFVYVFIESFLSFFLIYLSVVDLFSSLLILLFTFVY